MNYLVYHYIPKDQTWVFLGKVGAISPSRALDWAAARWSLFPRGMLSISAAELSSNNARHSS